MEWADKIALAKNLKRPERFQATNSQGFQLFLREIQSRNLQEPDKSELSKALSREAKQLFNLPARIVVGANGAMFKLNDMQTSALEERTESILRVGKLLRL